MIVTPRIISRALAKFTNESGRKRLLEQTGLTGYFPECKWLEWFTGVVAKFPKQSVIHFIYAENSYHFMSGYRKAPGCRVIGTYHQPPAESRQFILKTEAISRLDGVILLSESQREFFEPLVGCDRIHVVPHGIDRSFFAPSAERPPGRRVVAVGNWLRDFDTLVGALRILEKRKPAIAVDVVTLDQNRDRFRGLRCVQFHAGISDLELLRLYQAASVSVLSLSGAAANNALLESMASGLPVVATDLPAVREYSHPDGFEYVPARDGAALAEALASLVDDHARLGKMGEINRRHSTRFSWESVAARTMEVYSTVSAN